MDKSSIKNFAIEARKILMKSAITQAGFYGITDKGCSAPIQTGPGFEVYKTVAGTENRIFREDMEKRKNLVQAIENKGFDQVIEETAYTWFNRLIAIRFMEVNDYLPSRVRVLSSETGSSTPDIVSQFYDVDLNLSQRELELIQEAIDDNRYDDAFVILFVKQCNELNDILPGLFEKTNDYMELLLKLSYTGDGVVRMLVDTIPESNFNVEEEGQVEIIGWLYQYYNTEPKSKAFAKKGKITKEEIPAVTQLFTPDWIVRYMVENSLGRLWAERNAAADVDPDDTAMLKDNWKYYLEEAEQESSVQKELDKIRATYKGLNPEDIKLIDPCMGSGHILVYAFDVLMQIYESCGYRAREAVASILENNLYGLDIDDRAYQMAYFAVMMKARSYDKRFLKREEKPVCHLYSIQESNHINKNQLKFFGASLPESQRKEALKQMQGLLKTFQDAKEYGSILNIPEYDWALLREFVAETNEDAQLTFESVGLDKTAKQLAELIEIAVVMARKYHVVTTNPPYMSELGKNLQDFVKTSYPDSKHDLCTVFIEKGLQMVGVNGYVAMITQHAFMFLSRYEKLRRKLLQYSFTNMAHLGSRAFEAIGGEVVQTTAFAVRKNYLSDYVGKYLRLVDYMSEEEKRVAFLTGRDVYYCKNKTYDAIPRSPMTYWASDKIIRMFSFPRLDSVADPRVGLFTTNNERYLREWWELNINDIGFGFSEKEDAYASDYKWFPYNKGGGYRRWYGNVDLVVYWHHGGEEIKRVVLEKYPYLKGNYDFVLKTSNPYYKPGITWSGLTSGSNSFRLCDKGFLFDTNKGAMLFEKGISLEYLLALLNSSTGQTAINFLNSTISLQIGDVAAIPVIENKEHKSDIEELSAECVRICKRDWDSREISWDFETHPLVNRASTVEKSFIEYEKEVLTAFDILKKNEETINRLFASVYDLEGEVETVVADGDISIKRPEAADCIKSLISYAVGCMFGRYSLEKEGLIYGGSNRFMAEGQLFEMDEDGIIPITDEEYLSDDIVSRFCKWLIVAFGEESFEENLDYIAKTLKGKGKTSREVIRNYFITGFFKDHCQTYSATGSGKRPIYWLFDSGKQNGFKALIYLHRYNKDTVGTVRSVYLKKVQEAIEASLKNAEYIISSTSSAMDRANATKRRDKYIKQLAEIRTYYMALTHVALQRIELDLDDGVKVNYAKFQGVEIVNESGKKQKIDLLAKI